MKIRIIIEHGAGNVNVEELLLDTNSQAETETRSFLGMAMKLAGFFWKQETDGNGMVAGITGDEMLKDSPWTLDEKETVSS